MKDVLRRIDSPGTYSLFGISVFSFLVFFMFQLLAPRSLSSELYNVFGALSIRALFDGQIWRMVTSIFLHADFIHLAFNMYALFFLGKLTENFFGTKKLVSIFLYSALAGALLSVVWSLVTGFLGVSDLNITSGVARVGASGGIFGLLGFILHKATITDPYAPSLPVDRGSLIIVLLFNLFYGFTVANIDNAAHLGGLIGGFLLGYLFRPLNFDSKLQTVYKNLLFFSAVLIVGVSYVTHILYILLILR